jgi:lipopolysaccharide transport system permease protein
LPARLLRHRDLLLSSLAREWQVRLRGTALGMLWPFIQPLCLFGIYGLVFGSVLGVRMPAAEGWGVSLDWSYGLWLWTGALVWASVSESIGRAVSCIVDQRGIVRKLAFPSEVLPLQTVLSSSITLAIGVSAFLAASWIFMGRVPGPELLWIPLIFAVQTLLLFGAALFVAACQVFLRDTQHLLGVLLTLAMFATPVFWVPSIEVLPGLEPWLGFVHANPLHHLLEAWRWVLLPAAPAACFTGSLGAALTTLLPWAVGTFLLGFAVFAVGQDHFADEV